MFESSQIELSQQALANNIGFLKNMMGKGVKISSVVKGNAYGHGIAPFVKMAMACGIDHFSVFCANEALEVHNEIKENGTIIIMGQVQQKGLHWAIANNIEFFVFDTQRLQEAIDLSKELQKPARIHIELETGMNRTGFSEKDLQAVIHIIQNNRQNVELKGLCTHYAGAENMVNYQRIQEQIETFCRLEKMFSQQNIIPQYRHTACSAASVMFPETRMDMVRIGIMQYGLWPSPETFVHYLDKWNTHINPLKRVITWKSNLMTIRRVNAGENIGYGNGYVAYAQMKIAVVPVGYSQGYSRTLSNQGRVLVRGKLCPVVGTVNMNMMLIDVTEMEDLKIGEDVVMIGNQENQQVTIASFSDFNNQLNYELLTRLPSNIPRKIIQ